MKTLSVRFYKRLILIVIALLILIPTVAAIVFGLQNAELRRQLAGGEPEPGPVQPKDPLELVGDPLDYQELYPQLYSTATIAAERLWEEQTVYLTFDSTPSASTGTILDVLDEQGVKATFFVNGVATPESKTMMKAIVERGHTIGLRSYSDSYQRIYGSVAAYLEDFQAIYDLVYQATGVRAEIFRYPGGSINAYNSGIYQQLNAEMLRRNFVFFDWSVSGESTGQNEQAVVELRESVLAGMAGRERGFVALQDVPGDDTVASALPEIIEELRSEGYGFQPLTAQVLPVIFNYKGAS